MRVPKGPKSDYRTHASGVIEGACRHVVKDRMERAGMHWTLPGAQALLNLRCVALDRKSVV